MERTEIPAQKTASEIIHLLIRAGASQITTDYGPEQQLIGLRFSLIVRAPKQSGERVSFGVPISFALPVRVEPVFRILTGRRNKQRGAWADARDRGQAERVAWRQLLRWVQAQLAMIEVGMVENIEVFMPYAVDLQTGQTMFQAYRADVQKMLTAGSGQQ